MNASVRSSLARIPLIARLILIALVGLAVIASITSGAASELLRAVDFLAPKPGLSGLLLVFLAPFGFLLALALVAWAITGIRRARPDKSAA